MSPHRHSLARAEGRADVAALDLAEQVASPVLMGQALAALNDALGGPSHTMTRRE